MTQSQSVSAGGSAQAQSPDVVKQVQQGLKDKGIDAGPVDGRMGPQTMQGLKQFQEQQKIQGSGQLNQETLTALGVSGSAGSSGSMNSAPARSPSGGTMGRDTEGGRSSNRGSSPGTSSPSGGTGGTGGMGGSPK